MKTKVCIVGANKITLPFVDWEQGDTDYWLFNEMAAFPVFKRCDGVFQMHVEKIWRNHKNTNHANHYLWLGKQTGTCNVCKGSGKTPDSKVCYDCKGTGIYTPPDYAFPIWMQKKYGDVPEAKKYPLDEVCETLLPNIARKSGKAVQYFTSSAAYALALAIYQGYKEIEICGVEMTSDTEYFAQRDGVTFWLGIATGRGIKVTLQDKSILLRAHLYGYTGEVTLQRQRLEIVARALAPQAEQAKATAFELSGKVNTILKQLAEERDQDKANKLYADLIAAFNEQSDKIFQYGVVTGQLAITNQYIAEVDSLIQAAGGEKALQVLTEVEA